MTDHKRVQPTPFDAPTQAPTQAPGESTAVANARPSWLVPALGGLAVLALIVIFVLPSWVDSRDDQDVTDPSVSSATDPQRSAASSPSKPTTSPKDTADASSPFADARAAKARAEAQELLAELLDVQENLSERGAEEWAVDEMGSVAAAALAGDELYREHEFDAAIEQYRQALTQALALEQSLPARFEAQLDATRAALESLDLGAATRALALADQLEPGAPETASLAARVDALPGVIEDVAASREAEDDGDLAAAVSSMKAANERDAEHQGVQSDLQRLQLALTEERFNEAMSSGYAALDASEFSQAQQSFERAGTLAPGSSEVAAALQELSAARTAAKLSQLQKRGETLVSDENWSDAIRVFEEALAVDKSLRFAREGLAIAKPRGQIAKELAAIVKQPERLVDDAILQEARSSVARAQALGKLGPRLSGEVQAAQDVLAVASTPLPVNLSSDGLTQVTVYKVARLGLFEQEQLELRPGKYTAVGSRRGYRDVRVVFTVAPNNTPSVRIACNELI